MKAADLVRAVIDYLASQKQLALLPQVAEGLTRAAFNQADPDVATVTTVLPLAAAQKLKLAAALKRLTGRPIKLRLVVDPDLVGGMKINLANQIIDLSFNRQLAEIEETVLYA
jgi:F-type H+-transporting ATPase subunit delta